MRIIGVLNCSNSRAFDGKEKSQILPLVPSITTQLLIRVWQLVQQISPFGMTLAALKAIFPKIVFKPAPLVSVCFLQ